MSLVGDEDEAGCGGVHAVADDCEREAGEGEVWFFYYMKLGFCMLEMTCCSGRVNGNFTIHTSETRFCPERLPVVE